MIGLIIADGDALLWAQGIAAGYKFDVDIHEPDVSPLQVQGPNSKELMVKVFGEWVNDLGFYRYKISSILAVHFSNCFSNLIFCYFKFSI